MAGDFIRMSLDSWRGGRLPFAVLHAGVGCEYILKALLCRCNPLLISDKGDQAHRFHALGLGDAPGVKPLSEARTVGILEAFKTAAIVMQGRMPVDEQAFRPFATARNSVAHYAYLNERGIAEVVEVGLLVVEAVRTELGLDRASFWGEYESVFADLAKVAVMRSPAGPADRRDIEVAAGELALAERAAARAMLVTAVAAAIEVSGWGVVEPPGSRRKRVDLTALRTALVTGLRVSGTRACQTASRFLTRYEILPFPPRPDALHAVSGMGQKAKTAVAVKVLFASNVIAGLTSVQAEHPDLPILTAVEELDHTGWLRSSMTPDGDRIWWRLCPACGYGGGVYGDLDGTHCWCPPGCPHPGRMVDVGIPESFSCPFCGLTLTHGEELEAAGIETGEIEI